MDFNVLKSRFFQKVVKIAANRKKCTVSFLISKDLNKYPGVLLLI